MEQGIEIGVTTVYALCVDRLPETPTPGSILHLFAFSRTLARVADHVRYQ